MNLAYPLENDDKVIIDGVEYQLDMSFDNILRLFDLLEDRTINNVTKIEVGLRMLIDDTLDDYDIYQKAEIFTEIFKQSIGVDNKKKQLVDLDGNPMPDVSEDDKKVFDLTQDAEYIYASFMHTYRIDLFEMQGKLHWKKFKALLNGLSEDSIFSRVVGIRTAELPTGKGMAKERERLRKLKRQYALDDEDEEEY